MENIRDVILSKNKQTNCFFFYNKILEWIKEDRAKAHLVNDSLFIFFKANGFYKLYYYVDTLEELFKAKNLLEEYSKEKHISLEFTSKNNKNITEVTYNLTKVGFIFNSKFIRLLDGGNKLKSKKEYNKKHYILATLNDCDEILKIMHENFNIIIDDIPSIKELKILIKENSVILKKVDNKIIFFEVYKIKKLSIYSAMFWIDKNFRKPKYTVEIYTGMEEFINSIRKGLFKNEMRKYFWVNERIKAYKLHLMRGSKPDGLSCSIFTYKKEYNEG